jgi:hypothetical protein
MYRIDVTRTTLYCPECEKDTEHWLEDHSAYPYEPRRMLWSCRECDHIAEGGPSGLDVIGEPPGEGY